MFITPWTWLVLIGTHKREVPQLKNQVLAVIYTWLHEVNTITKHSIVFFLKETSFHYLLKTLVFSGKCTAATRWNVEIFFSFGFLYLWAKNFILFGFCMFLQLLHGHGVKSSNAPSSMLLHFFLLNFYFILLMEMQSFTCTCSSDIGVPAANFASKPPTSSQRSNNFSPSSNRGSNQRGRGHHSSSRGSHTQFESAVLVSNP